MMSVADSIYAAWHSFGVRTHDEILAELIRQRSEGLLRNADVQKWIAKPSSAVSNLFSGGRRIQPDEMSILAEKLWPNDAAESRVSAEFLLALQLLLPATGMADEDVALVCELIPAIREEMQSAATAGDDPQVAARTAVRLLWQPGDRKGRVQ